MMNQWIRAVRALLGLSANKAPDPRLEACRDNGAKTALVFVHGFQGRVPGTWTDFIRLVLADPDLTGWDVHSLGFPSRLSLDLPLWKADPGIVLCARSMATKLRSSGLERYDCVAIIAHSMGGLVAQRAILDTAQLDGRLSHLMLFGTPSLGLHKAGLARLLKFQLRDMGFDSSFIVTLRRDWDEQVGAIPRFAFRTIAGETDAFVPGTSSLDPFSIGHQEVVPGNHLEIVRPQSPTDISYDVFKRVLRGDAPRHSIGDTARLAVERKEYRRAIELLEPNFATLDADTVVLLALALESDGRSDRALEVMETWAEGRLDTDPQGAIGGRLKRRWLVERRQPDLDRALALYRRGFEAACASADHSQAFYHAINVAFLLVASMRDDASVPEESRVFATLALDHCSRATHSAWRDATQGEAKLILGDLDGAVAHYAAASAAAGTVRHRHSMYVQATALAARIHGQDGRQRIDVAFGILPPDAIHAQLDGLAASA